jgi:anti-sigma regulatory factor (Ser/Thr protein kinase)
VLAAMERSFPRSIQSLEAIFAFVDEFLARENVGTESAPELQLLLEELFANSVRHARGSRSEVQIGLEREGQKITMRVTDFDVEPFDPRKAPEVDVNMPMEDRVPGGLGLHLVRRLADRIDYDYRDRVSTVTVTVSLER